MSKNRYTKITRVTRRSLGVFDVCRDSTTNEIVAVKTIQIADPVTGIEDSLVRKISLAKELNNQYIIRLLDVRKTNHQLKLVFEYLDSDLLASYQQNSMHYVTRILTLHRIICGIEYLHSLKLIHGDLKPECVLVDSNKNIIKIADAGLVKSIDLPLTDQTPVVENFKYKAPEILLGDTELSTAVDMWSVGCMLAELVTMRPLFRGESAEDVLLQIFRFLGVPNEDSWPGVTSLPKFNAQLYNPEDRRDLSNIVGLNGVGLDLLSKLLRLNPAERMKAFDALAHPFFEGR